MSVLSDVLRILGGIYVMILAKNILQDTDMGEERTGLAQKSVPISDNYPWGEPVEPGELTTALNDRAFADLFKAMFGIHEDSAMGDAILRQLPINGYARLYSILKDNLDDPTLFAGLSEGECDRFILEYADGLRAQPGGSESAARFIEQIAGRVSKSVFVILASIALHLAQSKPNEYGYNEYARCALTPLSMLQVFDTDGVLKVMDCLHCVVYANVENSNAEALFHAIWSGMFEYGVAQRVNSELSDSRVGIVRTVLQRMILAVYPEVSALLRQPGVIEGLTGDDIEALSLCLRSPLLFLSQFDDEHRSNRKTVSVSMTGSISEMYTNLISLSRKFPDYKNLIASGFDYLLSVSLMESRNRYPANRFEIVKSEFYHRFNQGGAMNERVPTTNSEIDIKRAVSLIFDRYHKQGRPISIYFGGIGNGQRFEGPVIELLESAGVQFSSMYATDLNDLSAGFPPHLEERINFSQTSFLCPWPELDGKIDVVIIPWSALNDMPKHVMIDAIYNWVRMLTPHGVIIIDSPLLAGKNSYINLIASQAHDFGVPGMMSRGFDTPNGVISSTFTMNELEELIFMMSLFSLDVQNVTAAQLAMLADPMFDRLLLRMNENRSVFDALNNPFYAAISLSGVVSNRMTLQFGRGSERVSLAKLLSGIKD